MNAGANCPACANCLSPAHRLAHLRPACPSTYRLEPTTGPHTAHVPAHAGSHTATPSQAGTPSNAPRLQANSAQPPLPKAVAPGV
eukprot:1409284-Alexandrium_andersonii.AAC.1